LFNRLLPEVSYDSVRKQMADRARTGQPVTTSADLPLSKGSQRALAYAAEEAEVLSHRHIGTEHLLLGLLREETHPASRSLRQYGADLAKLRLEISRRPAPWFSGKSFPVPTPSLRHTKAQTVDIHGSSWNVDYVYDAVKRCREYNWHWQKRAWKPRDIVVALAEGSVSFDLSLADDPANFRPVKRGWKRDHCVICRWELFESDTDSEHGMGYTNGRDWLCTECYEKFLAHPGFFSSTYPEIT